MTTTAAEYAEKIGVTVGVARYRLNKLVKAGKAVTWIEKESVLSNVYYTSSLPKRVRYYDIEEVYEQ